MERKRFFRGIGSFVLILVTALSTFSYWGSDRSAAQGESPIIRQVRAMQADETGIALPLGLFFSPQLDAFYVLDGAQWSKSAAATDLLALSSTQERKGTAHLQAGVQNPVNMAYDERSGRLLILQAKSQQLVMVGTDPGGALVPRSMRRLNATGWGAIDPQGMAVEAASGDLYVLDAAGPALLRVKAGQAGEYADADVTRMDLSSSGISAPRGMAIDPSTGNLHILSPDQQRLFEVSPQGKLLAERDLSPFGLKDTGSMVFAPSGDQTDDPERASLYLAEQGTGQILEFSFAAASVLPPGTSLLPATLVRTFVTAGWTHPAPDPSGIDYWPLTGKLLIADSEIEEAVGGNPPVYWQGFNVFLSSLGGSLSGNCTTYTSGSVTLTYNNFANEPTGVGINPANNRIYFTNDGGNSRLFELNPGPDSTYCTSDDTVVRVRVGYLYGATDAEDVAYGNNTVFLADGINGEVYVFPLGADGLLATPDDGAVTHWDTSALGFDDLEGIGYNADSGTLFIVSTAGEQNYLGETTATGTLLNVYDLSLMGTDGNIRSDVTFAPSSDNPAVKSIYICSRGIDNNWDRFENDGMIWEINIGTPATATATLTNTPGPSPTNTLTPTVTNTPVISDTIFADGFESGNFSAWSASQTDSADLAVNANSAMVGGLGMRALIDDTNLMYVMDNGPAAETRYRARFYFDPNSITMANGDMHNILNGLMGTSTVIVRVQFRYEAGSYQVKAGALNDAGTWLVTGWLPITDAPHSLEFDWQSATGAGANNGVLTFWIDGVQMDEVAGIDNDTRRVDAVRLGAVTGIDVGTHGTYFFDGFEARRFSYIGPVATATSTPGPSPTPTFTLTPSLTPTVTNTPALSDGIFADGFESGSFSAWSASETDLGDLAVNSNSAMLGNLGMRAMIDDINPIYVTDESPNSEGRYRARFYFDPNSIVMVNGDVHNIMNGMMGASTTMLRMQLRFYVGNYQVRVGALDDAGLWLMTSWFTVTDGPHSLEFDWRAATAPGANDGSMALWIDGSLMPELSGIDNDTLRVDAVRLGAVTGIDAGTLGTYFFDAFESRRFSYIGP